MSMLAERRTKKKWCLNPNGKDWSNDDNKFGQRLLEKMGWKKGCGLGVNLQGMKDHVRVSAKNDTKGLGCKNNSDAEWIHHQQNFENLLSELASSTNEEITLPGTSETKPVSLEEKSKKSRVRVHYQKFTRGKDVARYSANDLACIFGKKSFEMQYSCHVNTRNLSEAGSEVEDTVEQSLNLCKEKSTGDCLPSLFPKHRVEDQPVFYNHEDKGVKEKQTDILKEISNVKENSVADLDIFEECKSEMKDNSPSHHSSESLEKIRSKRKRKHVKDSEISNVKENSVEELDIFEECKSEMKDNSASHHSSDSLESIRSKRKRKHVKDSEISNVKENSVEDLAIVEECKSEMKDNSASHHPSESLEKIRSKRKRKHVKYSEISNVKENSVEDLDIVEECKREMKYNSATHHSSESSEKIKSKKKRKRVNNSENSQEVFTDTIILNSEEEVIECDTVAHEVEEEEEEEEKKKRKKKKKDKKKKVKVDETGKEVNKILIEELIEVISDSEETGNKDLDNAGESNEADTGGSEMEKIGELYQTNILEAHEECPEMKKRKRKKKKNPCSQPLNEPEVVEDITSEIVSPLPPDNEARVNNVQKSTSYASEQFSSNKNESHPDHSNRAGKHWKTVQKLKRTSMDFGFKGSNLHTISGYGRLRLSRADVLVK